MLLLSLVYGCLAVELSCRAEEDRPPRFSYLEDEEEYASGLEVLWFHKDGEGLVKEEVIVSCL